LPTLVTHAAVGLSAGLALSYRSRPARFWILAVLCAVLPDLDVLAFKLGIPYAAIWGHRGFFHSLFFSLLVGMLVSTLFFRRSEKRFGPWLFHTLVFTAVTASHGLLDALTNGGLGVALLAPFDNARYFFPTTPISVAPLSLRSFLSGRGLAILKNELLWVWTPALIIATAIRLGMPLAGSHSARAAKREATD